MKIAKKACGGAQFPLANLQTATAYVIESCDQLIAETRHTIQGYTATIQQL